jgi:hypothetical protein
MATQICPNCKEDSFTWSTDENDNGKTITTWGCSCGYFAYEDESKEKTCDACGKQTKSELEDENKIYWWCSNCNRTELIKNKS